MHTRWLTACHLPTVTFTLNIHIEKRITLRPVFTFAKCRGLLCCTLPVLLVPIGPSPPMFSLLGSRHLWHSRRRNTHAIRSGAVREPVEVPAMQRVRIMAPDGLHGVHLEAGELALLDVPFSFLERTTNDHKLYHFRLTPMW